MPRNRGKVPLAEKDPEKFAAIKADFEQGLPMRLIAAKHNLATASVQRVRYSLFPNSPAYKTRLSNRLGNVIDQLVDKLEEKIDKVTPNQLPIALGILIDKRRDLDIEAPQICRTSQQTVNFNVAITSLPSEKSVTVDAQEPINTGLQCATVQK